MLQRTIKNGVPIYTNELGFQVKTIHVAVVYCIPLMCAKKK